MSITKEEAAQFRQRWLLANKAIKQEQRRMTLAEKVRGLCVMFEAGRDLGWQTNSDECEVRARWVKLKERLK